MNQLSKEKTVITWKRGFQVITVSLIILAGVYFSSVLAADQIKTQEIFIGSATASVSSATSTGFSLYVGDNLSGVTSPMKSLYFTISGLYTGNGTFDAKIDNDTATLQSFTLPNVGTTPVPFEFIYKDPSNKINPQSAGNYFYTLDLTPSGITIYGLGMKMKESHRYAPPTCADGASANEKIKTQEIFIGSATASVSSATSTGFSLYVGDNLSGVTSPMKSLYFTISGLYTGNGTFDAKIDNDTATLQSFTLPNVGTTPVPFEFIYKDPSNKINPQSAGNYFYTLDLTPSGITIYGLGMKMKESHRYKPPSCETGYPATGELTSAVFDTGSTGAAYNSILWKGSLGTGGVGKVRFQLATSNCSNGATNYPTCSSGTWSYVGSNDYCNSVNWFEPASPYVDTPAEIKCYAELNNKRYYRYKVQICSDNCVAGGTYTPTIDDVVVSWSP